MLKKLSMLIVLGVLLCALALTAVGYHRAFADSNDYQRGYDQGYSDMETYCANHGGPVPLIPSDIRNNPDAYNGYVAGEDDAQKYCNYFSSGQ